ncbi:MAG TPA: glycerol kinase GlpK [Gaiellaceae bacterium]|jgi:glycerol kinase|nr:glycerol kinase GlpK [Gaiellaceae bacterium]
MREPLVLAIDQGTTGTTCLVVDRELRTRGRGYAELRQHFPRPGWVEHDPEEIWTTVEAAAEAALGAAGAEARYLTALGIANQRETTLLWSRETGRPLHRAIVWQDRRTAARCAELPAGLIRKRTGLLPDPYFSATKLEWLLAETGAGAEAAFGTVDSWLVWKLTGGARHVTEVGNASRTLLFALREVGWDDELLELFGVPRSVLPEIVGSSEVVGEADLLGARIPLAGIAGDQQAALFGQACFEPGEAKATYGTGCFVLANAGADAGAAPEGLVRTVAWRVGGGEVVYALEGSIFVTGAALRWLRDGLCVLGDAAESEELALAAGDNHGVYFVPALAGLGSPHWAPAARGLLAGLTAGVRREHLVRAALEAVAYQTRDVTDAMGRGLEVLRADGGQTANGFLMQLVADLVRLPVEVPVERDTTALGAAALAGLAVGIWSSPAELASLRRVAKRYEPRLPEPEADRLLAGWRDAVARALL